MKIYIMRHGEAQQFAASDAQRSLTERGCDESAAVAGASVSQQGVSGFDLVLVSPYLRARQTWQVLAEHFSAAKVQTCDEITPYGQSDRVFDYLAALIDIEQLQSVLLVSHLPLVGYLVAELVDEMIPPMFPTSGMMCIDYDPLTQTGQVLWNIYP
ncbi:phosphohistidine phosphatase SixA [Vibrio sp. HDW18]|uniref:phosphohistidine phosphatase SixA n=1 Tax=Vibrio sp. HDW18 TaxID=2714948 RepID=UPI00140A8E3D|nr:phosphohistidine phosphatase SixA [Vibrio sp. HDW18]QIL84792.1 phosphohistidine phosphatase SixA [Vibrio sp. HDW18]